MTKDIYIAIIYDKWHSAKSTVTIIRTRIFGLCDGRYRNLSEMAHAMELSASQIYRVREGKRHINQKFIIGALKAFPGYKLDDLFYLAYEPSDEEVMLCSRT